MTDDCAARPSKASFEHSCLSIWVLMWTLLRTKTKDHWLIYQHDPSWNMDHFPTETPSQVFEPKATLFSSTCQGSIQDKLTNEMVSHYEYFVMCDAFLSTFWPIYVMAELYINPGSSNGLGPNSLILNNWWPSRLTRIMHRSPQLSNMVSKYKHKPPSKHLRWQ